MFSGSIEGLSKTVLKCGPDWQFPECPTSMGYHAKLTINIYYCTVCTIFVVEVPAHYLARGGHDANKTILRNTTLPGAFGCKSRFYSWEFQNGG